MKIIHPKNDGERVLQFFQNHPNEERNHREIVVDMGISAYTERILDARHMLGCTCQESKEICPASEHIVNTRKGFYKFVTRQRPTVPEDDGICRVSVKDIENRMERLRDYYRQTPEIWRRKIIIAQGRALQISLERERKSQGVRQEKTRVWEALTA